MKALLKYWLVLCVGLATPLFITVPAAAEDDAAVDMARQRFKEGVAFFDKKQYDKARLAFLQAYALKPHPAVLLNLAQSELRSDREAEAARHFAQYLREHGEATDEQRQAAQEGLETAKEKVGEVKLEVNQSGAEVSVDGETVGKSPLPDPLYLTPGTYTLSASKGDERTEASVTVDAGESKTQSLRLEATSAEPEAAPGPEEEGEAAEAEGEEEGEEEAQGEEEEEEGWHEGFQAGDGFVDWYLDRPLAWVGTGIFVLGIGLGVPFAITSGNYYDSADNVSAQIRAATIQDGLPSTEGVCLNYPVIPGDPDRTRQYQSACTKYQKKVDNGDKYQKYAVYSFVAAGVAAAGTIVYYVLDGVVYADSASSSPPESRAMATPPKALLVPYVGPGQGGLSVIGQF